MTNELKGFGRKQSWLNKGTIPSFAWNKQQKPCKLCQGNQHPRQNSNEAHNTSQDHYAYPNQGFLIVKLFFRKKCAITAA
jgi:hypothetical protein